MAEVRKARRFMGRIRFYRINEGRRRTYSGVMAGREVVGPSVGTVSTGSDIALASCYGMEWGLFGPFLRGRLEVYNTE